MNIYLTTALVTVAALILTALKNFRTDITFAASAFICLSLIGVSVSAVFPIVDYISSLELVGRYSEYFGIILKSVGASVICTAAAEICRDSGQGALAYGVETFCKCEIIAMSLPLIRSVLELAEEIMR